VSHLKERKEKNCLNCNAILHGKYCSICGQENIEPKESVWHLINHFFQDITHFDGKFFSSLKYLLIKPGFLSSEYARGRRSAYLNPIRFYVFTSFIFFFFMFLIMEKRKEDKMERERQGQVVTNNEVEIDLDDNDPQTSPSDTAINYTLLGKKGTTSNNNFYFSKYSSKQEYDSLLKNGSVKDNFFERNFTYKQIFLSKKYERNSKKVDEALRETFIHNLPLMFLFSLPFFAVFLKLIYLRKRNRFYVAHAIFAIHLYIFTYVAVLFIMLLEYLKSFGYTSVLEVLKTCIGFYMVYYYYQALRYFYEQGHFKSIVKFILIFFWLIFIMLLLLILFFFYSVYKL
jgi:hypothetical protein